MFKRFMALFFCFLIVLAPFSFAASSVVSDKKTSLKTSPDKVSIKNIKFDVELQQVVETKKALKDAEFEVIIKTENVRSLKRNVRTLIKQDKELFKGSSPGRGLLKVKATKENLDRISKELGVVKVYANRKYKMLLEDSVPLINADSFWSAGFTGDGVRVAVLDTGIDTTHPDLTGNIILERDFSGSTSTTDRLGHGSHVAGIVLGVAPDVDLINVKVLDDRGAGTTASIVEGINYAVDPDANPATDDGADIISLSLGAPFDTPDELIEEALQNAIDSGVKVVIASGNCGPIPDGSCFGFRGVTVPGVFEPAITVGAVANDLSSATFSSGQRFADYIKPDIVAPGVDITSAALGGGTFTRSGTSMSTPFVSGAVALLLERNGFMTQAEVKTLLETNVVDLGVSGKDERFGSGFMDLGIFLDAVIVPEDGAVVVLPDETDDSSGVADIYSDPIFDYDFESLDFSGFEFIEVPGFVIDSSLDFDDVLSDVRGVDYVLEGTDRFFRVEVQVFDGDIALERYLSQTPFHIIESGQDLIAHYDKGVTYLDGYSIFWLNEGKVIHIYSERGGKDMFPDELVSEYLSTYPPECNEFVKICGFDPDVSLRRDFGVLSSDLVDLNDVVDSGSDANALETISPETSFSSLAISDSVKINFVDGWGAREGYTQDGIAFTRNIVGVYLSDVNISADMVCYDWNYDDIYDNCYWDSNGCGGGSCNADSCDWYAVPLDMNDTWKTGGDIDGSSAYIVRNRICERTPENDCFVDTSNRLSDYVSGLVFYDCDNSEGNRSAKGLVATRYYVIDAQMYDCEGGDSTRFDLEGRYSSSDWVNVQTGIDCAGDSLECDEKHDDFASTSDDSSVLPDPCRTMNNFGCSNDAACISDSCEGSDGYDYRAVCNSAETGYEVQRMQHYPCCTTQCTGSWTHVSTRACTLGQICDASQSGVTTVSSQAAVTSLCVAEVVCGDGTCSSGEACVADCITMDFVSPPTVLDASQDITITVEFTSIADVDITTFAEVGIVPDSWGGSAYVATSHTGTTGCCPANEYYGARELILRAGESEDVPFTLNAPNETSTDACGSLGSAWGDSFTLIAGIYDFCSGDDDADDDEEGYLLQTSPRDITVNPTPVCPDGFNGASTDCMCDSILRVCPAGSLCNIYGACGEILEGCPSGMDGSSATCDCDNDRDCHTYHGPNFRCDFRDDDWDVCVDTPVVHECTTAQIDSYRCGDEGVEWCRIDGGVRRWVLSDPCSYREVCDRDTVATTHTCTLDTDYDLILESASDGTAVNKQVDDTLQLTVWVDSAGTYDFGYNSAAFRYISGNCNTRSFSAGNNVCEFNVLGPLGSYNFVLEDATETVNVINNPYILYVTNVPQLHRRYNYDPSVNVLLAKVYEKASRNNGVVYDLDREITGLPHPFDYAFTSYGDKLSPKSVRSNDYSLEIGNFIQNTCNGCKNTVMVGDDYVVPSFVNNVRLVSNPLNIFYTDSPYTERYTDHSYDDLDVIFRHERRIRGVTPKIILPEFVSDELNESIQNLKRKFVEVGLVGSVDHFRELSTADLACDDFREFSDFWFFDPLDVPIIIGTRETNPVISCFPIFSQGDYENNIAIEPSIWNKKSSLLFMNTNNPAIINNFADFVLTNHTYEKLNGRNYIYIVDSLSVIPLILTPVSGGTSGLAGKGLARSIVYVLDLAVTGADAYNSCYEYEGRLPESEVEIFSCVLSAAPLGGFALGRYTDFTNLNHMESIARSSPGRLRVFKQFLLASGKLPGFITKKIPKIHHERFLDMLQRETAGLTDEAAQVAFMKTSVSILENVRIRPAAYLEHPELVDRLGELAQTFRSASDETFSALEQIIKTDDDILDLSSATADLFVPERFGTLIPDVEHIGSVANGRLTHEEALDLLNDYGYVARNRPEVEFDISNALTNPDQGKMVEWKRARAVMDEFDDRTVSHVGLDVYSPRAIEPGNRNAWKTDLDVVARFDDDSLFVETVKHKKTSPTELDKHLQKLLDPDLQHIRAYLPDGSPVYERANIYSVRLAVTNTEYTKIMTDINWEQFRKNWLHRIELISFEKVGK